MAAQSLTSLLYLWDKRTLYVAKVVKKIKQTANDNLASLVNLSVPRLVQIFKN
jgi:hypothetical protein